MYRLIDRRFKTPTKSHSLLVNYLLIFMILASSIFIVIFILPHPSQTFLFFELTMTEKLGNYCKNNSALIPPAEKVMDNLSRTTVKLTSTVKTVKLTVERKERTTVAATVPGTSPGGVKPNFTDIINPHDFNYVILEKDLCRGKHEDVFMLIYVHTDPRHLKQRMLIRETWGSAKLYRNLKTVLVFMMGRVGGGEGAKIQAQIRTESSKFRDIVQEDFVDTYRNLTYKAVMGLKWISKYCPTAKYILKTDDDVFVNIFNLVRHLSSLYRRNFATENTIGCYVWNNVKVLRDKKRKWYVTKEEYAGDTYPTYCSGAAFLLTGDLPPRMFNESLYTRFFWIDDFFVTGQLAKQLKVEFRNFNSLFTFKPSVVEQEEQLGGGNYVFGHLGGATLSHRYNLWKKILKANPV